MIERIAQQMLERTDELFEHRPVELGLAAVNFEVRALVELARRRAQDPVETLGQAAEGYGANREQPLLHVARQARLRNQRDVGIVEVLEERLLHRRHVVHALGERPRQLLEARVPIELERIEVLLRRIDRRHPRLDLGFRLQFDFAHLAAQPYHAARELEQVGLQRAQLAFDARARDRHFTRLVHELVDDVRANAQHRAHRVGVESIRRTPPALDAGRTLRGHRRRTRRIVRGRHGIGVARCLRGGRRLGRRHEPGQRDVRLAFAQCVEDVADPVEVGIECLEQFAAGRHREIADRQPRFHPVRELAKPHRARHPRTALQRVQRAAQLRGARRIVGRATPSAHELAGLRDELGGLFEENRQDRGVEVVGDIQQRFVARHRFRCRRNGRQRRSMPCFIGDGRCILACGRLVVDGGRRSVMDRRDGRLAVGDGRRDGRRGVRECGDIGWRLRDAGIIARGRGLPPSEPAPLPARTAAAASRRRPARTVTTA